MLRRDSDGSSKCAKQVYSAAKIFFAMLMHLQDPCVLKHAAIVKDTSGDDARFFHEHFKGAPIPEKKKTQMIH